MNYRSLTNWICVVIISCCLTSCVSSERESKVDPVKGNKKLEAALIKAKNAISKYNKSAMRFGVVYDCGMAFLSNYKENNSEEFKKIASSCSLDDVEVLTTDLINMSQDHISTLYENLSNSGKESLFDSLKNKDQNQRTYPICINTFGEDSYSDYVNKVQSTFSDSIIKEKYLSNGKPGIGNISKVDIIDVLLFEAGDKVGDPKHRAYSLEFKEDTTKRIWVKLKVKNLCKEKLHRHRVIWKWYNSDGSLRGKMVGLFVVKPQWNTSWIERGWGDQAPGGWKKGKYKVELIIDDKTIERHFTII